MNQADVQAVARQIESDIAVGGMHDGMSDQGG